MKNNNIVTSQEEQDKVNNSPCECVDDSDEMSTAEIVEKAGYYISQMAHRVDGADSDGDIEELNTWIDYHYNAGCGLFIDELDSDEFDEHYGSKFLGLFKNLKNFNSLLGWLKTPKGSIVKQALSQGVDIADLMDSLVNDEVLKTLSMLNGIT